jgi:calmodulin
LVFLLRTFRLFFSSFFPLFFFLLSLQVIETQKERAAQFDDESDLIDAYVACGGNADKSGCVSADMLIKIIKHDFGLTIDIEELIRAIDTDGSGEIEFEEFKTLLS